MRLSSRKCDSTPEFRNTPGCRYARRQPNNSHIGRPAPAESFAGCAPALFGLSGHSLCQFQWTAHSPGSKRTGQPRTDSSPGLSFVCGFLPESATVHQNFGTRLAADTHAASQITAISADRASGIVCRLCASPFRSVGAQSLSVSKDSSFAGIKTDWSTANRQQPESIVCMRLSSRKCDSTPEFRNTLGCRYARRQPNNSHPTAARVYRLYAAFFQKVRQYTRISEHAWLQICTPPVK